MGQQVAVVGAGAAGTAAAYALRESNAEVTIFEKSGGVCGRAATRRQEGCVYEYGANYLTADDERVNDLVTKQLPSDGLVEIDAPVWTFDGDGEIEQVYVEKNGAEIPYAADEYVLATGGLVGKGIESERDEVYEPIFGCHIAQPDDRYAWSEHDAFGDHEFARFGVQADAELRPTDAADDVAYENLRAAGSVLGGYDFAAEKSGSGVSIATGYAAGRSAAARVR